MTGTEYVAQIERLIVSGQHQAALDFAQEHYGVVLTFQQKVLVDSWLEGAAMVVSMEAAEHAGWPHPRPSSPRDVPTSR